jgi:hypothetical protein
MFEKVTLCIYGIPLSGKEGHMLYETAKNDVPIDRLNKQEDMYEQPDNLKITNDDIDLLNTYTIDTLISPYIKCDIIGGLKKAYLINPPNLNMVEKTKTGYIYYENDLNYYTQSLYNFYLIENKTNKSKIGTLEENNIISFQTYYKKISDIIKILLSNNKVFLEDDCVFNNDNYEIFHKIPEILIDIIVYSLSGNIYGYTEIKNGLKLLRIISSSSYKVGKFIEKNGIELLYNIILNKDYSLVLKVLVLENIYRLITHNVAFKRLLDNIDRNKFPQEYFMVKESTKDIDYDKDDRKKKKKKKSKRKNSDSRSSRSRSRSYSRDSYSSEKRKKKKQAKNILLKNGYQIIMTMLIGKKNHLVINLIKKIINKISLLIYLKELSTFVENIVNFINLGILCFNEYEF